MNIFLSSRLNSIELCSILESYNYTIKKGDILAGRIVGVERHYALVNLGLDKIGLLPKEELITTSKTTLTQLLQQGSLAEFAIVSCEKNIILSLCQVSQILIWERIKQLQR